MRKQEPRSFAPIDEDELPEDVRNFTRLFRTTPDDRERTVAKPKAPAQPRR